MYSKAEEYKKLFQTKIVKSKSRWFDEAREAAVINALNIGQPSLKDEEWRYTKYVPGNYNNLLPSEKYNPQYQLDGTLVLKSAYNIFISNGNLHQFDEKLPKGLVICKLSDLAYENRIINNGVMSQIKFAITQDNKFNNLFNPSLNTAFCTDPIVIFVDNNIVIDKPINLLYIGDDATHTIYSQCVFIAAANSKVSVIEHFLDGESFAINYNHISRFIIGENACLNNHYIQNISKDSTKHYTSNVELENDAIYNDFSICIGGSTTRREVHADINNKSICDIRSVVIGNQNQHHDTYFNFQHSANESYSNQVVKQILDDKAKGVFYGKVHIPKNCVNSEAHQLNKNILLSNSSQVFSRPELEIYTDEVKCTHGSTTGNIDEEALYYLKARGFDEDSAIQLLLEGFYLDMLEQIKNQEIKKLIEAYLVDIIKQNKK